MIRTWTRSSSPSRQPTPTKSRIPDEGLRERKKRRVRQRISDVATAMFMVHGFDQVTVAQIAAACEVSLQTVFNYFPTKESMLFDRFGSRISAVADAVRERGSIALVETVVQALAGGIHPAQRGPLDEDRQLHLLRLLFNATGSPSLAGARLADFARFTEEMSDALANRVRRGPDRPRGATRHLRDRGPGPSPAAVNLQPRPARHLARRPRRRRPTRPAPGRPARRTDPHRVRPQPREAAGNA